MKTQSESYIEPIQRLDSRCNVGTSKTYELFKNATHSNVWARRSGNAVCSACVYVDECAERALDPSFTPPKIGLVASLAPDELNLVRQAAKTSKQRKLAARNLANMAKRGRLISYVDHRTLGL